MLVLAFSCTLALQTPAPHVPERPKVVLIGRVAGCPAGQRPSIMITGNRGPHVRYRRRESGLELEPDGRFRSNLGQPPSRDLSPYALVIWAGAAGDEQVAARVEWAGALVAGEHDVGVLQLSRPPLLASGRVLAPNGAPLPGAEVVVDVPGPSGWPRDDLHTRSLPDGSFAVRGFLGEGEETLRLRLRHRDLARSEGEVLRAGARDVELAGVAGAVIEGRVFADEKLHYEALRVEIAPVASPERTQSRRLFDGGEVRFSNLTPGVYSLSVFTEDAPSAKVAFEHVRAAYPGGFESIDLRGRLHVVNVRVVDPSREAPRIPAVYCKAPEEAKYPFHRTMARNGAARLITPHPALDLRVDCPPHRFVELEGFSGDQVVATSSAA